MCIWFVMRFFVCMSLYHRFIEIFRSILLLCFVCSMNRIMIRDWDQMIFFHLLYRTNWWFINLFFHLTGVCKFHLFRWFAYHLSLSHFSLAVTLFLVRFGWVTLVYIFFKLNISIVQSISYKIGYFKNKFYRISIKNDNEIKYLKIHIVNRMNKVLSASGVKIVQLQEIVTKIIIITILINELQ